VDNAEFVRSGKQDGAIIFTPPGAPKVTLTSDEAHEIWRQLGVLLGELPDRPVDPDQAMEWLGNFIAEREVQR
jgi:hypothetical protein